MNKKQLQKYNIKDTLLMVSLYPKRGETYSEGISGVASYAKNVITHIDKPVVVLAHKKGKKIQVYEEDNVLVIRCFDNNKPYLWAQLIKNMYRFNKVEHVLVQHDFAMYGGMITTGLVLPFLGLLKLMGKKTYVTFHHVVSDVKKLSGHVGLKHGLFGAVQAFVYNKLFHAFYYLLGQVTDTIVVLEKALELSLANYVASHKVVTIPHGVDTELESTTKRNARKNLGIAQNESVILFFGFVNWFKGADLFVDTFSDIETLMGKKVRIILAGGESSTLKNKEYYKEYFNTVLRKIHNSKRVEITGYVPQEKIGEYFAASDLVVFPYREMMTASGVLSLTFSYKRPFIASKAMGDMFKVDGFKKAFSHSNIKLSDVTFGNKTSCLKTTEKVLENGLKTKLTSMARIMRKSRSYQNTAKLYENVVFDLIQ